MLGPSGRRSTTQVSNLTPCTLSSSDTDWHRCASGTLCSEHSFDFEQLYDCIGHSHLPVHPNRSSNVPLWWSGQQLWHRAGLTDHSLCEEGVKRLIVFKLATLTICRPYCGSLSVERSHSPFGVI